jgi:hypothetical protein
MAAVERLQLWSCLWHLAGVSEGCLYSAKGKQCADFHADHLIGHRTVMGDVCAWSHRYINWAQ